MAAKQTLITITHGNEALQTVKDMLLGQSSKPRQGAVKIARFVDAVAIGNRQCKIAVQCTSGDAVAASGTITLSAFAAADTVTVGSQVFTGSASPSGNNQFLIGGSDTATATALAAKINAHPSLAGVVTASAVGAAVTVTSAVTGLIGNMIALAISAHGSVSAARLAGGLAPTTVSSTSTMRLGV